MTQRIFDVENEKDMADLWDILPDDVFKIKKEQHNRFNALMYFLDGHSIRSYLILNWHDKTEITRPIQEAKEADIGKLCKFALKEPTHNINGGFGILTEIRKDEDGQTLYLKDVEMWYNSCCRLTKQDIEELI